MLTNANGLEAHILPYGAIVQKLLVPDASGVLRDVVLGFDELGPYQVSLPVTIFVSIARTASKDNI